MTKSFVEPEEISLDLISSILTTHWRNWKAESSPPPSVSIEGEYVRCYYGSEGFLISLGLPDLVSPISSIPIAISGPKWLEIPNKQIGLELLLGFNRVHESTTLDYLDPDESENSSLENFFEQGVLWQLVGISFFSIRNGFYVEHFIGLIEQVIMEYSVFYIFLEDDDLEGAKQYLNRRAAGILKRKKLLEGKK